MTILDAMDDPALFADTFGAESWTPWRWALAAIFALVCPNATALDLYRACTGRSVWPTRPAREVWALIGRRGGKSRIAALIAVWLACFRSYRLAVGERGVVLVVAADRSQAKVTLNYVRALLAHRMLSPLVASDRAESIDLTNGITIAIATASYRTIRGRTVIGAVLDEVCFWRSDDAAEPDLEVVNAIRPAMATVPDALIVGISTPYSRRGVAWRAFSKHHGRDESDTLVWRAPSLVMNPSLAPEVVEAARAEDPSAAAAEWDAEFRSDLEALLTREAVEACVEPGRHELAPVAGVSYSAFCDPSGGSADSMTLAVAHREGDAAVLDAIRERWPPFSPEAVVSEFAELLRSYSIGRVTSDRYASGFHAELWEKQGIRHFPAEKPKSDLYREIVPVINSTRAQLLDHPRLIAQLVGLERRTARGGRDTIDHGPGAHDDLANAAAGVVSLVLGRREATWEQLYGVEHEVIRVDGDEGWQRLT